VSPVQGKLLMLLAQATGARHILEIGTLGGYSTIWLARALPEDGRLITLEYSPLHAEVARRNIDGAGLGGKVEVRVGRAQDTLRLLVEESLEPFDLIFIDADKQGYPEYLKWSLQLSRSGTVIIADNVVRNGEVIAEDVDDPIILGIRRFNELLAAEPRVSATILQVVGSKGYDGLAMALVQ
jgi:predicted O-methyltransferase YrrM